MLPPPRAADARARRTSPALGDACRCRAQATCRLRSTVSCLTCERSRAASGVAHSLPRRHRRASCVCTQLSPGRNCRPYALICRLPSAVMLMFCNCFSVDIGYQRCSAGLTHTRIFFNTSFPNEQMLDQMMFTNRLCLLSVFVMFAFSSQYPESHIQLAQSSCISFKSKVQNVKFGLCANFHQRKGGWFSIPKLQIFIPYLSIARSLILLNTRIFLQSLANSEVGPTRLLLLHFCHIRKEPQAPAELQKMVITKLWSCFCSIRQHQRHQDGLAHHTTYTKSLNRPCCSPMLLH